MLMLKILHSLDLFIVLLSYSWPNHFASEGSEFACWFTGSSEAYMCVSQLIQK